MTYTLTLDGKSIPIVDICNIHFNIANAKDVTFDIKTKSNGDFHYECLLSETEKFNSLWMLKTDIGSYFRAIAEGRIVVD